MEKNNVEREYLMLREEIMKYYDIIHGSRNTLYVVLAAILTLAIPSDEPLLCLVPYCVIIPVYIVTIDYQYGMWRMGTYLSTFLEGEEFNWETRLRKLNYNVKLNRHATSYHWPFAISGLGCTILFFLKIDYSKISYKMVLEIIFSILLTVSFLIFVKVQKNPDEIVQECYRKWRVIKEQETT